MLSYLPIILMVIATTCYHIGQKSVPPHVNPFSSLILNYATALAGTLALMPLHPTRSAKPWSVENLNWASCAVGVSIVGVEVAVLLAYRIGWRISIVSVIGNTASAILLVVIGLVFFHEHLSGRGLIGVALCLAGLALITHREQKLCSTLSLQRPSALGVSLEKAHEALTQSTYPKPTCAASHPAGVS